MSMMDGDEKNEEDEEMHTQHLLRRTYKCKDACTKWQVPVLASCLQRKLSKTCCTF